MIHDISDETLAHIIRDYWQLLGYKVDVDVRECTRAGRIDQIVSYRAVRSNLLNAIPRGYSGDLAVMPK